MAVSYVVRLCVFLMIIASAPGEPRGPGGRDGRGRRGGPGAPGEPKIPGGGRPNKVSRCTSFTSEFCPNITYTEAGFPNLLGHQSPEQANEMFSGVMPLIHSGCSDRLQDFLCGVHFPECEEKKIVAPCRALCLEAFTNCSDTLTKMGFMWPPLLRCDRYPEDGDCFGKEVSPTPPVSVVDTMFGDQPGSGVKTVMFPKVGMFVNPVMDWLKSSTNLNRERSKLSVEEIKVAKLTEEKLDLEIKELRT